jgi:transcriptional regulator with XRE-family HTH domain
MPIIRRTMSTIKNLAEQRVKLGIKQITIAKELSVTKTTMSRYESGKRDIPSSLLDKYAEYLGYELKLMVK